MELTIYKTIANYIYFTTFQKSDNPKIAKTHKTKNKKSHNSDRTHDDDDDYDDCDDSNAAAAVHVYHISVVADFTSLYLYIIIAPGCPYEAAG